MNWINSRFVCPNLNSSGCVLKQKNFLILTEDGWREMMNTATSRKEFLTQGISYLEVSGGETITTTITSRDSCQRTRILTSDNSCPLPVTLYRVFIFIGPPLVSYAPWTCQKCFGGALHLIFATIKNTTWFECQKSAVIFRA